MKTYLILALLLLLIGCEADNNLYLLTTGAGSSSLSGNEYSNYYIAHDTGEESAYNISGTIPEEYEVHIE